MARGTQKLTARAAATTKAGRYSDGGGLYLIVSESGARKWVFRFTFGGRVSELGLGSGHGVSLADARIKARDARTLIEAGKNPVEEKKEIERAKSAIPTFGTVADELIASKEREWRNEKHRAQWRSSLETYTATLRSKPVDQIDTAAVLEVLKPLWQEKPETASRVRGRIEAVLNSARAQNFRTGENPAAWRGHLEHLLPKRAKLSRGHHSAMSYKDVPAFASQLSEHGTMAALALEFAILTAARSAEVYGATWSELDLKAKVWNIPANRMKGAREHRVPLCARAVDLLNHLFAARTCDYVFTSPRGPRPLSHIAMAKVIDRLKVSGATPHGFRSSFRDWVGNETTFSRELAEAALAHLVGDETERAYRRGDALEKRRKLMDAWGAFLTAKPAAKVLQLPKKSV